jgi:hypothetical protein
VTPEELKYIVDERIEERMEAIASLAAKKALQNVYAEVGRGVVKKVLWLVGIGALFVLIWLAGNGHIRLEP